MLIPPYLTHREDVAAATELMCSFGAEASFEAAARASRSRDIGNHVHFCRWRQVERLILLLSVPGATGTVQ
jgi:hypothetical protein